MGRYITLMKLPNRIIEILLAYFMVSPLLGIAYIINFDPKAILFWSIYLILVFTFIKKLFRAFKIGSFPYYFTFNLLVFLGFGWFQSHATENNLHNSGGVGVFMLPIFLFILIYTKNSKSYKQVIDVFNKT